MYRYAALLFDHETFRRGTKGYELSTAKATQKKSCFPHFLFSLVHHGKEEGKVQARLA